MQGNQQGNSAGKLSPKFKRISLNKAPSFLFLGLNICVYFDLKNMKKLNQIIYQN